jgi:hypothetical protein
MNGYFISTVIAVMVASWVMYRLITRQLMTIHDLVNSNLHRVQSDLKIALDRIETLEMILTKEL